MTSKWFYPTLCVLGIIVPWAIGGLPFLDQGEETGFVRQLRRWAVGDVCIVSVVMMFFVMVGKVNCDGKNDDVERPREGEGQDDEQEEEDSYHDRGEDDTDEEEEHKPPDTDVLMPHELPPAQTPIFIGPLPL